MEYNASLMENKGDEYAYASSSRTLDILVLTALTIVGTSGNCLIFLAVARSKQLRKLQYVFVLNLAFADLIITAYILPLSLAGTILGRYPATGTWCTVTGLLITFSCGLSISSLALIAFNRYVIICRTDKYSTFFNKGTAPMLVLGIWVWSIFGTLPPVLGWSNIAFGAHSATCAFMPQESLSYTLVLMIIGVYLPAVLTLFSYYRIYLQVSLSRKALLQVEGAVLPQHIRNRNRNVIAMFVVFVLFILFWTPYSVVIVLQSFELPSHTLTKATTWIGLSNSVINSFIYGALNKTFRHAYRKLCCFCVSDNKSRKGKKEAKHVSPPTSTSRDK